MINFLNLKYFLILSEEMNFRKAAHKLYITQQSLSGHIQKLRNILVPLFYRSTPLRLTPVDHLKNRAAELLNGKRSAKELLDISGFIGGPYRRKYHVRTQVLLVSGF
ncbi:MAG: LysR family transcriptional regulator [Eisenbergiella sp.]